jgi:tripeptidyl-peptidase-1
MSQLLFVCSPAAAEFSSAHTVLAPQIHAASGWSRIASNSTACAAQHMRATIVLRERNLDTLEAIARSVSDPHDTTYGRHMSTAAIAEMTAPAHHVRASLVEWLSSAGVRFRTMGQGAAWSAVMVESMGGIEAGRLFGTNCSTYRRGNETAAVLGDLRLPSALGSSIAAVFGVHEVPSGRGAVVVEARGSDLSGSDPPSGYPVTPGLIRSMYSVPNATRASASTVSRSAVMEFGSQGVLPADLASFFANFVPAAQPGDENVSAYRGDSLPPFHNAGGEASLDADYIMGVAPGVPTEFWSYHKKAVCAGFVQWTTEALAMAAPPLVVSVSWGYQGDLSHFGCTPEMQAALEVNHMKLAAAGVSVVHSSGDGGSGYPDTEGVMAQNCPLAAKPTAGGLTGTLLRSLHGVPIEGCCNACVGDPSNCAGFVYSQVSKDCDLFSSANGTTSSPSSVHSLLADWVKMFPAWPATSPWVTAVGGTELIDNAPGHGERAVSAYGSGGGFAVRAPQGGIPSFQASAVGGYLALVTARGLLPPAFLFNQSNRATPDVAALGYGFQVRLNGDTISIGGTSASAPTFAALLALINDARLAAKKPPLGFVSPLLYAHPEAFTDVTVGNNSIGRGAAPLGAGWSCEVGWDAATGLGTPRFDKLLAVAMAAV